jgi:DNA-binding transcriptional regulator YiaG
MFKELATALNGSGAPAPAPVVATKKQKTAIVMLPEMVELKRIRLELGLTQKQLGEMLGSKNVNRWEQGKTIPHTRNLLAVRKFIANHNKQAPKSERHVVKRAGAVPLRFKGVKLGSYLLSGGDVLTLYRTDGGQVVWDTDGTVNYGTTEAFVDYWAGFSEYREVLAFAADSGLEIFEDID